MKRIRWGVLSTAKIAREKVIPAMQRGKRCTITALASRNLVRAQSVSMRLGISNAYGTYEALLSDPDVDAIYNPLPNHLHVPWSIRALEAGKHVLCEKPIGLDADDARRLKDAAAAHPRLKVMEAFMYRIHPQWQKARALVQEGAIGEPRTIHSFFSYFNVDPDNVRNRADIGGGALMDIGCYCISVARFIFEAEPERVLGKMDLDPGFGTDRLTFGMLDFGDRSATFTCGTQLARHQRVQISGSSGRIEIEIPFNAPPHRRCKLFLQQEQVETISVPRTNQYTLQGDLFAESVLDDKPVPTPLDDAVANMKALDAIRTSAMEGRWISL